MATHTVSNVCIIDTTLQKSITDTLRVERRNDFYCINDKTGYCKLSNDSIMVFNYSGLFMAAIRIGLYIKNGEFSLKVGKYSCFFEGYYTPIEQKLVLNKPNFQVNDTIVGELLFKGVLNFNRTIDTTTLIGKFKFRVREASYDYHKQGIEDKLAAFSVLAHQQPDTIKHLDLSDCELTELPKELTLFKTLKI